MKRFLEHASLTTFVQQNSTFNKKSQINTVWHWLLLFLFGLLAYGSIYQKFLLIGLFIGISALVNGPLMILWGAIYSALVAFFPPIGILLSLLFLMINLGSVVKSWRITLTSVYFYLVPLASSLLQKLIKNEHHYLIFLFVFLSILGLHFLLNWLYKHNSISRSLTWRIVCVPYSLLLFLLPKRFHPFKRNKKINL